MHIFGYVTDGFQSLNHSAVLNSLVFKIVRIFKTAFFKATYSIKEL